VLKNSCLLISCVIIAVAPGAWSQTSKDKNAQTLSPVTYVRERSFTDLRKFGAQARAYTLMMGDRRIVTGVDFIRNLSGISQELPSDLSDYVVNVIGRIGPQFGTYRKYGGISEIPGALLAQPPQADHPAVDFWVSGSLEGDSEVTKYESKKGLDGTGGGGHTQWDAHAGRNRTQTIKSLTVTFTLTGPDKVSIPGASATYRIDVGQLQRERTFSVYVAGSGISLDSTVTITQHLDDAIYDATAASIIHLLGNALMIPYYRCSSVFQPDEELDKRVHESLSRLTRRDLEHNIKIWMLIDGYPMAASELRGLTDHDRAIAEVEMYHRSLNFNSPNALIDFGFSLWKDLDYLNGANRVEAYLAEMARIKLEEQAKLEQAKLEQEEASRRVAAEATTKQKHAAETTNPTSVKKPRLRNK
jgi:hypothetical protein